MNQEDIDVDAYEAAIIKYAGQETLDVIQKREAQRRSDAIEKATSTLWEGQDEIKQQLDTISREDAQRDFESVNGRLIELANKRVAKSNETFEAAMAAITLQHPQEYEQMLQKRQMLILTKAAIDTQAKKHE